MVVANDGRSIITRWWFLNVFWVSTLAWEYWPWSSLRLLTLIWTLGNTVAVLWKRRPLGCHFCRTKLCKISALLVPTKSHLTRPQLRVPAMEISISLIVPPHWWLPCLLSVGAVFLYFSWIILKITLGISRWSWLRFFSWICYSVPICFSSVWLSDSNITEAAVGGLISVITLSDLPDICLCDAVSCSYSCFGHLAHVSFSGQWGLYIPWIFLFLYLLLWFLTQGHRQNSFLG